MGLLCCFRIRVSTSQQQQQQQQKKNKNKRKRKKIFVLILDNKLTLSLNMISFELYTAHLQILIQLDIDGIVNVGYEFVLLKYLKWNGSGSFSCGSML